MWLVLASINKVLEVQDAVFVVVIVNSAMTTVKFRRPIVGASIVGASRVGAVIGALLVAWVVLIREAGVATIGAAAQGTLTVGASRSVFTTRRTIISGNTWISFAH